MAEGGERVIWKEMKWWCETGKKKLYKLVCQDKIHGALSASGKIEVKFWPLRSKVVGGGMWEVPGSDGQESWSRQEKERWERKKGSLVALQLLCLDAFNFRVGYLLKSFLGEGSTEGKCIRFCVPLNLSPGLLCSEKDKQPKLIDQSPYEASAVHIFIFIWTASLLVLAFSACNTFLTLSNIFILQTNQLLTYVNTVVKLFVEHFPKDESSHLRSEDPDQALCTLKTSSHAGLLLKATFPFCLVSEVGCSSWFCGC